MPTPFLPAPRRVRAVCRARALALAVLLSVLVCVLFVAVAVVRPASAQLRVDVNQGFFAPLPIAVPYFHDPAASGAGREVAEVVAADLERSGLFRIVDRDAHIQTPESLARGVRFGDWRLIDAQLLLAAQAIPVSDNRFRVEFRLYDSLSEKQILALSFTGREVHWRRIGHLIADRIYERVLGESGYFDSRIAYVAETGSQLKPRKRLAIMDQDGHNHRFLTDGQDLVLTPRFSPDGTALVYLSFASGLPAVHLYDLKQKTETPLGDFPGMTFAPRFSPDGNQVVMSLAREGNTDIYKMNLASRALVKLTAHSAIDTSPSFSPDGNDIVFNSDRGGKQQLYRMDKDGNDVRRISFGQGRYATPVWSPRGDLIAFTRIHRGIFYIGVMHADGTGERQLARGFSVEAPTWSPNGRVLSYFKEERATDAGIQKSRLYSVDISGHNERQIPTPIEASDPAWSPLNP